MGRSGMEQIRLFRYIDRPVIFSTVPNDPPKSHKTQVARMQDQPKWIAKSRTFWMAILAILALVVDATLLAEIQMAGDALLALLPEFVAAVSMVLAVIFRKKATQATTWLPPKDRSG